MSELGSTQADESSSLWHRSSHVRAGAVGLWLGLSLPPAVIQVAVGNALQGAVAATVCVLTVVALSTRRSSTWVWLTIMAGYAAWFVLLVV
jgi:hypothetical protein